MDFRKIYVNSGGLLAIMIGVLGLLAYIPGGRLLGSIRSDYIPMAPSTAGCFIMLGALLMGKAATRQNRRAHTVACLLVFLTSVFGILAFMNYFIGVNLNLEGAVLPDFGRLDAVPVGRMSPITGIFFSISGLSLLLLFDDANLHKRAFIYHLARLLSCLVIVGSLTFILGYLYGRPLLYDHRMIPMALTTALGFLFLGTGMTAAVGHDYFPANQFSGPSTYARLMRVFLPLCLIAVLSQDIITRFLPLAENLNNALTAAAIAVIFACITAIFVYAVAQKIGNQIDRSEAERKRIDTEREKLISDLQSALTEVKTLSGLLPICSSCKKIRNDNGYWQQIEGYIHEHSGAQFTHGICPECAKKLYPDMDIY